MNYANWETKENILKNTIQLNERSIIERSGIPILYDDNNLYINNNESHQLIIGATGSGKTQTTILPQLKLSMLAGESVILNDVKGDIYERTAELFKSNGYEVVVLNFDNPKYGSSWNPLTLPYMLYKTNDKDKSIKIVEDIAYYLFADLEKNPNVDPFWQNMTINYFTGLVLYLFENATETQINLKSVFALANDLQQDNNIKLFLNKIGKNNSIYYSVAGTLESPLETRAGIIATFNQKSQKYLSREMLSNMMLKSTFDISELTNKKMIIYIISGMNSYSNTLLPLFVSQVFESTKHYGSHQKIMNVILDDFDNMLPIKDISNVFNYSRSLRIRYTIVINSFKDLINTYGKVETDMLKLCFGKIIYLLSNDIYTLEEISNLCGYQEKDSKKIPLITVEELKCFNIFEALFLMTRTRPFKTKLIPDYQINWPFTSSNTTIPVREENQVDIYNFN